MTDGKNCLKHVERLTEINKLRTVASCWLYSENILAMHGPMNVKKCSVQFPRSVHCKDLRLEQLLV